MLSTFGCPDVVEAPKGPTIDAVTDAWRNSSTQRKIHSGGEAQERHKAVKKPRHRFSGDARHVGLYIVPSHVWWFVIVHAEESTDDIEDDDVDVSKAIRSIFKYDRRRYEESSEKNVLSTHQDIMLDGCRFADEDEDDLDDMEVGYLEAAREESRT